MKYFKQFLILNIFILLIFTQALRAINYDKAKTKSLKQHLNQTVRTFRETHKLIKSIEWSPRVRELIEEGADPNIATNADLCGSSPLHFAAQAGDKALIIFLLSWGANIDQTSENGMSPLRYAARHGHRDAAILLMSLGAKVNFRFNEKDKNRELLLKYAEKLPGEHWLHHQIRIESNDELKDIFMYSYQDFLEPLINQFEFHGHTLLDLALAMRHEEAISLLLLRGADPVRGQINGLTLATKVLPSTYKQIHEAYLKYYLDIINPLSVFQILPREVIIYIIEFVLHPRPFIKSGDIKNKKKTTILRKSGRNFYKKWGGNVMEIFIHLGP